MQGIVMTEQVMTEWINETGETSQKETRKNNEGQTRNVDVILGLA